MAETYSLSFNTIGEHNYDGTELETGYSFQKTITILSIPICILGLFGNAIIFCLLSCSIRKTNFTVYFLNLVVADFVVLIYYVIVFVLFLKALPISLYSLHLMDLAHTFGFNAKTYVLTAITAERYVMIFCPAWYLRRPKNFSEIVCAVLWGISGLLAITLYCTCYIETDKLLEETNQHCESTKMARVIINLLVFLPIMVFSTYIIFTRMMNVSQETPLRRLDITIVATVLLFLLFAASVRIIEIIARWVPKIHIPILFLTLHFLDAIDSSGNPYLYLIAGYSNTKLNSENLSKYYLRELCWMMEQHKSRQELIKRRLYQRDAIKNYSIVISYCLEFQNKWIAFMYKVWLCSLLLILLLIYLQVSRPCLLIIFCEQHISNL